VDTTSSGATVYSETVVHSAPERYAAEAPYQIAIVDQDHGSRLTVRIVGAHRVGIGDRVTLVEERDGVAYYQRQPDPAR
jgi:uncharacterized OB-fold protein